MKQGDGWLSCNGPCSCWAAATLEKLMNRQSTHCWDAQFANQGLCCLSPCGIQVFCPTIIRGHGRCCLLGEVGKCGLIGCVAGQMYVERAVRRTGTCPVWRMLDGSTEGVICDLLHSVKHRGSATEAVPPSVNATRGLPHSRSNFTKTHLM